jgi:uridine phosphorylase
MNDTVMIINPCREKGEPELPAAGMLVINPADAAAGHRLAEKRKGRQHFLFNSRLAILPAGPGVESCFMAGPAVGAPMAVMTLEKLVALGARRIIVFGWCGSLHESMRIGNLVLPTWAISTEGTSAHYPLQVRPESHAATRQLLADWFCVRGLTARAGPVWTTDAPYRESIARVDHLGRQGVLGVEMEYGALVAAAAFRNIELAAVLLISDELFSGTWKPGFRTRDFKNKSSEVLHSLVEFCPGISAEN